jgi:RHS repeat-associated protein
MNRTDADLLEANDLAFTRNALTGRVIKSVVPGVVTTHIYDTYGAETQTAIKVKGIELQRFQYIYDQLGRISSRTTTRNDGTSSITEYAYDTIGQLLTETTDGVSRSYSYTDNGNRITAAGQETYDAHDRLISDVTWNYTYNPAGHLRRKDNKVDASWVTYQYDALGNLLGVDYSNGTMIRYLVDGMNRRIRTKVNDQFKSALIYQDELRPIAQLNPNGSVKAIFVYGHKFNVPDLMIKAGVSYRIISDHLGSPLFVIREGTGQIMQEIKYDTWGNVMSDSNPGFQPFGFAGGLYDSITGLVRFGARDYDPSIGRWLNKDPIRFDGGWNLYGYVGNDPINYIDPDGKIPIPLIIGAIIGGLTAMDVVGDESSTLDEIMNGGTGILEGMACASIARAAWLGSEISLGSAGTRIAPFGNRAGHPTGKFPHYHRRGKINPKTGQPAEGQGIKRHRPWDSKPSDKNFWDRF